jgi:hypothetical protein
MSKEHVAAMNERLREDEGVRAECGKLGRPYAMAYRLSDGPVGETVHWTMSFDDTVQFSLDEHPSPDISFVGDWSRMVRASAANRKGEQLDPGVRLEGDVSVMETVGPVFAKAQSVATLPVDFPDV